MKATRLSVNIIIGMLFFTLFASSVISTDDIYASSKSTTDKVKTYRKSIKLYKIKTQKLAKQTLSVKKLAKKTNSFYKKSKKTKKIKVLKSLKSKAKKTYNQAQRLDYNRQIKDINTQIKNLSFQAPSMNTFTTQAQSICNKAKKSNSVSTIKKYLSQIKTLLTDAKSHKSTLTWHDAEYRQEWVDGHYKKVTLQEEKWEYWLASFCAYCANEQGTVKYYGTLTDYNNYVDDMNKRYPPPQTPPILPWAGNHLIIPGESYKYGGDHRFGNYRLDNLDDWGCLWYSRDLSSAGIVKLEDAKVHMTRKHINGGYNWIESGLWVCTQDEVSEQRWTDGYYNEILIREAGWY